MYKSVASIYTTPCLIIDKFVSHNTWFKVQNTGVNYEILDGIYELQMLWVLESIVVSIFFIFELADEAMGEATLCFPISLW